MLALINIKSRTHHGAGFAGTSLPFSMFKEEKQIEEFMAAHNLLLIYFSSLLHQWKLMNFLLV